MTMNLYSNTEQYTCHIFRNREEWKENRIHGIGGSDSSTFVNLNPYKTPDVLWKEKKGIIEPKEIDNEFTRYGIALEPIIRDWFKATHKNFEVQYIDNCILQSNKVPWRLYSPDGLLYHEKHGKGILEIKTTLIQNSNMYEQWRNQIPQHYYVQVLHGLLTTDFDYIALVAELRFAWKDDVETKTYFFTKEEVKEDLEWLDNQEQFNWNEYYVKNVQPSVIINF